MRRKGFAVEVGKQINTGIPFVVGGTIQDAFSCEYRQTYGMEDCISTDYNFEFSTKVPPHSTVAIRAVVTRAVVKVPYVMKLKVSKGGKDDSDDKKKKKGSGPFQFESSGDWCGVTTWGLKEEIVKL